MIGRLIWNWKATGGQNVILCFSIKYLPRSHSQQNRLKWNDGIQACILLTQTLWIVMKTLLNNWIMNSRFLSRFLNCYAKKSKESNLLSVVKMVSNPLTPINDRYVIFSLPWIPIQCLAEGWHEDKNINWGLSVRYDTKLSGLIL